MDFILFHQKKRPLLIKSSSINMVRSPLKGNGCFIVTDMDGDIEVDETFPEVAERLQDYGSEVIEIVECAND